MGGNNVMFKKLFMKEVIEEVKTTVTPEPVVEEKPAVVHSEVPTGTLVKTLIGVDYFVVNLPYQTYVLNLKNEKDLKLFEDLKAIGAKVELPKENKNIIERVAPPKVGVSLEEMFAAYREHKNLRADTELVLIRSEPLAEVEPKLEPKKTNTLNKTPQRAPGKFITVSREAPWIKHIIAIEINNNLNYAHERKKIIAARLGVSYADINTIIKTPDNEFTADNEVIIAISKKVTNNYTNYYDKLLTDVALRNDCTYQDFITKGPIVAVRGKNWHYLELLTDMQNKGISWAKIWKAIFGENSNVQARKMLTWEGHQKLNKLPMKDLIKPVYLLYKKAEVNF